MHICELMHDITQHNTTQHMWLSLCLHMSGVVLSRLSYTCSGCGVGESENGDADTALTEAFAIAGTAARARDIFTAVSAYNQV